MKVSIQYQGDVAIVILEGTFTAGTDGPVLRGKTGEILIAGAKKLIFDFAGVPYIDSTGLGFLAASRTAAEKAQAKIILCGVAPAVKQILDRVRMAQFFPLAAGQAEAMSMFAAGGDDQP